MYMQQIPGTYNMQTLNMILREAQYTYFIIITILQHGFRIGYPYETQLIPTIQDLMQYRDTKHSS